MIKATLLSIGDELLIGQTVNTNVSWMGQKLNEIGIDIAHMVTLSDNENDIIEQINIAFQNAQIVLITGGLGPTSDDITRDTLCKLFDSKLVLDEKVLENINQIFSLRKRLITPETEDLANVPEKAITIYNSQGTAPGTIFTKNNKMLASMPGVPYEMKAMMKETVIPYIIENYKLPIILHSHILTAGVGETQISQQLVEMEKELPEYMKLAYLPSLGKVKLRLTAKGTEKALMEAALAIETEKIKNAVPEYIYGFGNDVFEQKIGEMLMEKKLKLGCAESCTGGFISHSITKIAGSSAYFNGSIIAYSNAVKHNILGVQLETLSQFGAVSEETVSEMIDGALRVLECDIAIAISGVAGPGGGSIEKPVGTVIIGIGNKEHKIIKRLTFTNDRTKNIHISGVVALEMLRKFLIKQ
ncbi:MAG: competence/damage-inducible protein A [Bacteroidetes bacterium]|nr:competence/damage-inducible protein A [Bacteroidota bacterium]